MKVVNKIVVFAAVAALTACSSNPFKQYSSSQSSDQQAQVVGANATPGAAIGGSVAGGMDSFDRVKLSHALDKSPGKSSNWVNAITGTSYTVTPVKKVTINGNPFCREYQAVAEKGGNTQQSTGTACVATDGTWSEVRG